MYYIQWLLHAGNTIVSFLLTALDIKRLLREWYFDERTHVRQENKADCINLFYFAVFTKTCAFMLIITLMRFGFCPSTKCHKCGRNTGASVLITGECREVHYRISCYTISAAVVKLLDYNTCKYILSQVDKHLLRALELIQELNTMKMWLTTSSEKTRVCICAFLLRFCMYVVQFETPCKFYFIKNVSVCKAMQAIHS